MNQWFVCCLIDVACMLLYVQIAFHVRSFMFSHFVPMHARACGSVHLLCQEQIRNLVLLWRQTIFPRHWICAILNDPYIMDHSNNEVYREQDVALLSKISYKCNIVDYISRIRLNYKMSIS